MVTVTATDAQTGAALSGPVRVNGIARGATGTPFSLTVPVHRVRSADGAWEFVPSYPDTQVVVPGYRPGTVAFDAP